MFWPRKADVICSSTGLHGRWRWLVKRVSQHRPGRWRRRGRFLMGFAVLIWRRRVYGKMATNWFCRWRRRSLRDFMGQRIHIFMQSMGPVKQRQAGGVTVGTWTASGTAIPVSTSSVTPKGTTGGYTNYE